MKTKAISSFFVLFAIASGIATTAPDAFADHSEVTITTSDDSGFNMECGENCYIPSIATVDVGGKVIFSNPVGYHSFTAGTWAEGMPTGSPSGEFDTGVIGPEAGGEWIAEKAGEIPYYCTLHNWMKGTIIVQEVEAASEEELMEDVELMVTITDSTVLGGTQVKLEFSELHVNYVITAIQNGEEIFSETAHAMETTATHQIDAVGSDADPIDIEIVSLGIGAPGNEADWTGPTGTVAEKQVVPEFGTIAMMILAVAIISIVAVTAKSRVVPRF